MKIGDLIKYRDRIPSDPDPKDAGEGAAWGSMGVVVSVFEAEWGTDGPPIPSVEYIDFAGDCVISKQEDLEVISASR